MMTKEIRIISRDVDDFFKIIKVKTFWYKGHEFGVPLKKYQKECQFNCYHTYSGAGTSIDPSNEEGLKKVEKRMGEDKFIKYLNNMHSIDENIENEKKIAEHNKSYFDRVNYASKRLGFPLRHDIRYYSFTGKRVIDLFDLEENMKEKLGYPDDGVSMNDFLTEKFDKEFAELINSLI